MVVQKLTPLRAAHATPGWHGLGNPRVGWGHFGRYHVSLKLASLVPRGMTMITQTFGVTAEKALPPVQQKSAPGKSAVRRCVEILPAGEKGRSWPSDSVSVGWIAPNMHSQRTPIRGRNLRISAQIPL